MAQRDEGFIVEKVMSAEQIIEDMENETLPKQPKDCFKTDPVSNNLLAWALRFEKWGVAIACVIVAFSIIVLVYDLVNLIHLIDELKELGSQAIGGLSESTISLYAERAFEIILKFGIRTVVAFAIYYFCKVLAALMLGSARRTHCMYVRTRIDEYKLRILKQSSLLTEYEEED